MPVRSYRALLLLVVLIAAAACGPSLETIHESNVRFEHCYRLDMDPRIASSHRELCWRDWTVTYAYGQSRDRIEYARRRIIALESGDTALLSIDTRPVARKRVFSVIGEAAPEAAPMAAPAPTSAHAPPPRTATEASEETPAPQPPPAAMPGQGCAGNCAHEFGKCGPSCVSESDECTACREAYRDCMRRCYE